MHTRIVLAILLCLFGARGLDALTSQLVAAGPHTELHLVSEATAVKPGTTLDMGLLFDLEPHWHIYWVNPGDSGEPPSVKWNLPAGFQARGLEWPAPQRLVNGPLTDYGYQDQVLLIAPVHVPSRIKQQKVTLSADVQWLVCSNVCISAKAPVSVDLPVRRAKPAPDAEVKKLFQTARRQLPQPLPANWRVNAADEGSMFRIRLNAGSRIRQASFFPLDFNQVENAKPQNSVPLTTGVELTVVKSDQSLKPVQQLRGILVIDGGRAYQVSVRVTNRAS